MSAGKSELFFYVISVSLLFAYLVLRAVYVPVIHDEAATFFNYVHNGNIFPPITRESANNHYLNTVLTYLSYLVFGSDKWALRIPNVLSSLLFFYFSLKISKLLTDSMLRYGLLITLFFCFNFIDFFALSRGYGMSMAFLIAFLFYTIMFFQTHENLFLIKSSVFLFFMLSANLATLIPALAIVLLHLFVFFFKYKRRTSTKLSVLMIVLEMILLALATVLLLKLKSSGALYLGTPGGGFFNAVRSWIVLFTGDFSGIKLMFLSFFAALTVFYTLFALQYQPLKYFNSPAFILNFVFWLSITGSIIAATLFGVYYPEGRVGLYLYPLFILALFFTVDGFAVKKWHRYVILPLIFIPVYSIAHLNFKYVQDYKNEVIPKRFYKKVLSDEQNILPTIAGYHMETTMWGYLNYENGGKANLIDWTRFPDTLQDYQLFDINLYPGILKVYDEIDYEPVSQLSLMKRKKNVGKKLLKTIRVKISEEYEVKPFINLWNIKSGFENKIFFFDVKLSVKSQEKPLHAWLVFQSIGKNGKSNIYKYIPFDWLKDNWDGTKDNFKQSLFSGKIPVGSKEVKLYIWNIDKKPLLLNGGTIGIYEIE